MTESRSPVLHGYRAPRLQIFEAEEWCPSLTWLLTMAGSRRVGEAASSPLADAASVQKQPIGQVVLALNTGAVFLVRNDDAFESLQALLATGSGRRPVVSCPGDFLPATWPLWRL